MKLQEFIDILDQLPIPALDFFKKNGKDIFKNNKLLLALMNLKWSKKKYDKLGILCWIIALDIGAPEYGGKNCFNGMLPIYGHFADCYDVTMTIGGSGGIPFEEYEDLAKEKTELLKTLVIENKLDKHENDPRVLAWAKKRAKRRKELIKKGYKQLDPPFSMGS